MSAIRMKGAVRALLLGWCGVMGVACSSLPHAPGPPVPTTGARGLYPGVVTVGDTLDIGYFLDSKREEAQYRIGIGDVLRIEVTDHPELQRDEVSVLPDGRVSLSVIGALSVVGKTVDEVGTEAAAQYAVRKIRDPEVVVSVVKGQQRLRLLMDSLSRQQNGSRIEVRIYDEPVVELPFIAPVAVGRPLPEIRREIREAYAKEFGGQLDVTVNLRERTRPSVYVMGEIKRPGAIELSRHVSLAAAVATAGGLADTADPDEVLVIRFDEEGNYRYWEFDLDDRNPAPDHDAHRFQLQANDVVYVAKSGIARVDLFVEQYIRRLLPFELGVGASYRMFNND